MLKSAPTGKGEEFSEELLENVEGKKLSGGVLFSTPETGRYKSRLYSFPLHEQVRIFPLKKLPLSVKRWRRSQERSGQPSWPQGIWRCTPDARERAKEKKSGGKRTGQCGGSKGEGEMEGGPIKAI